MKKYVSLVYAIVCIGFAILSKIDGDDISVTLFCLGTLYFFDRFYSKFDDD